MGGYPAGKPPTDTETTCINPTDPKHRKGGLTDHITIKLKKHLNPPDPTNHPNIPNRINPDDSNMQALPEIFDGDSLLMVRGTFAPDNHKFTLPRSARC